MISDKLRKTILISSLIMLVLVTVALLNYSFFRTCDEDYNPCAICRRAGYKVTDPNFAPSLGEDIALNVTLDVDKKNETPQIIELENRFWITSNESWRTMGNLTTRDDASLKEQIFNIVVKLHNPDRSRMVMVRGCSPERCVTCKAVPTSKNSCEWL